MSKKRKWVAKSLQRKLRELGFNVRVVARPPGARRFWNHDLVRGASVWVQWALDRHPETRRNADYTDAEAFVDMCCRWADEVQFQGQRRSNPYLDLDECSSRYKDMIVPRLVIETIPEGPTYPSLEEDTPEAAALYAALDPNQ